MENKTLTVREAAAFLNISEITVRRLIKSADFPVLRIGRKVLIPGNALAEWVRTHTATA